MITPENCLTKGGSTDRFMFSIMSGRWVASWLSSCSSISPTGADSSLLLPPLLGGCLSNSFVVDVTNKSARCDKNLPKLEALLILAHYFSFNTSVKKIRNNKQFHKVINKCASNAWSFPPTRLTLHIDVDIMKPPHWSLNNNKRECQPLWFSPWRSHNVTWNIHV